jgi:hypothetical protein
MDARVCGMESSKEGQSWSTVTSTNTNTPHHAPSNTETHSTFHLSLLRSPTATYCPLIGLLHIPCIPPLVTCPSPAFRCTYELHLHIKRTHVSERIPNIIHIQENLEITITVVLCLELELVRLCISHKTGTTLTYAKLKIIQCLVTLINAISRSPRKPLRK